MKNILIKGGVGTGKTYIARAAAYYMCMQNKQVSDIMYQNISNDIDAINSFVENDRCEYIQVYPGISYEDIVYGIGIKAFGSVSFSNKGKRIKVICDRAINDPNHTYSVIIDDISRTNIVALLGNLNYALEHREERIPLPDGGILMVPENVIFLFAEGISMSSVQIERSFRRRMDYVVELESDKQVIIRHYSSINNSISNLIITIYDSIKSFITSNITVDYSELAENYVPGHGMFMVSTQGTDYEILKRFKRKLIYQIFPFLDILWAEGIIQGDIEALKRNIDNQINLSGQINTSCLTITKALYDKKNNTTTTNIGFTFSETKNYFSSTLLKPSKQLPYRDVMECMIDAIILNGVFTAEILLASLLCNTQIISIRDPQGNSAAYFALKSIAPNFSYSTPGNKNKNNKRVNHSYYSCAGIKTGRWESNKGVSYLVAMPNSNNIVQDGNSKYQEYIPLNGVRCHNLTNDVCKQNNPAEIYIAVYKLVEHYLNLYQTLIFLSDGNSELFKYIELEKIYFTACAYKIQNAKRKTTDAKLQDFLAKIANLHTIWTEKGGIFDVDKKAFFLFLSSPITRSLVVSSVSTADNFINQFEAMINVGSNGIDKLQIINKGVDKMTDTREYQKIMEDIDVRQMIFQGPPGTSKTYECKKFVLEQLSKSQILSSVGESYISGKLEKYKLSKDDYDNPHASSRLFDGGWDVVQFHPSYGYEDFVRGIEVKASNGTPTYKSVNRILGKIAEFARISEVECKKKNQPVPNFYLIIDEINRANVANVFGELIYALEYRDSMVSTPYEVEDKTTQSVTYTNNIILGKNLFILGTMNTADKSIDSIDYAIRRRFIFIDSPADRNVVIDCYKNITGKLDENSIELIFFDAVQCLFDDQRYFNSDYQKNNVRIGHTYFLRKDTKNSTNQNAYADLFKKRFIYQVLPILREYVKDGIFETNEDLIRKEHTVMSIKQESEYKKRIQLISDNIMLYAMEFGNVNANDKIIDNNYIEEFMDKIQQELGL